MQDFYINDQFFVEPQTNSVTDTTSGAKVRVESRVMQLLCLLANSAGKTVSRDELVNAIWNDYGGGDEGLTQSISMLRKVLADNSKEMVQTIPKKGYVLIAVIRFYTIPQQTSIPEHTVAALPPRRSRKIIIATLCLFAIVVAAGYIVYSRANKEPSAINSPINVDFPDELSDQGQTQETANNTITTQPNDSTSYKLIFAGNFPVRFFINKRELPEEEWEPYMFLIKDLTETFKQRTSKMNSEEGSRGK